MHTTVGALLDSEPIAAQPCQSAPLQLPAGKQELLISPGPFFTVVGARLTGPLAAHIHSAPTTPAQLKKWTSDHREVDVTPSPVHRVLVEPESVNPGWTARTANGAILTPVTINGWQQGWVLPAGTAGIVTLTFGLNTPYRIGLFGGLALLPLLALLALLPTRRRVDDAPTQTWQPGPAVVGVALVGFGFLVAGFAGLATVGAAIGIRYLLRSQERWLDGWTVIASASGLIGAGAVLSAYPWRSVDGYVGHSPWVQFLALISVAALAASTWDAPTRPQPVPERR